MGCSVATASSVCVSVTLSVYDTYPVCGLLCVCGTLCLLSHLSVCSSVSVGLFTLVKAHVCGDPCLWGPVSVWTRVCRLCILKF